ncbi:hypothetical protein [Microlunatus ginsengisoli]|uniref:Integral membrane protein n=1 Tax=Microlunatus ginsengisoli TaxID=363863 RepID=A0ABP7AGJ7_9ACTN
MTATDSAELPERRAERLKERIYVTFTSLAVVIAMSSRAEDLTPGAAAVTLTITVVGTLLAVFVADLVAHIVVHATMPAREELGHMVRVSSSSLGVLVLPLIFIGLAGLGRWHLEQAMRASSIALAATLIVIGYLAARRLRLPLRSRLVILFAEFGLGVLVVLLELLAHTYGESH